MKKSIKVKPNSQKQKFEETEDGILIIHLKSPPLEGKANEELIKVLAERFAISKSKITIKSGSSAKNKIVELDL